MEAFLQWLNQPGLVRWVVDILVLPLVAVLLIFALRALLLRFTLRGEESEAYRKLRRQTTKVIAVILGVVAVAIIWRLSLSDLAGYTEELQRDAFLDWMGGAMNAVIATAILLLSLFALNRSFKWAVNRLDAWREAQSGVQLQRQVLISSQRVRQFAVLGLRVARFAATIVLFYFYVPLVLSFIPTTRPLVGRVMPLVLDPARDIGLAFLAYLPRLAGLILIIIAVRYLLRFLGLFMAAVGKGEMTIPGFDAEWADQTARLLKIIVVFGTLMVVYPFLPGAGSEVFRGFSLFAGALFTLGASSSVGNVISGVILTYTRSFRIGDRIEIGDTRGDVISRGLFVTRLRTIFNEEITYPNAIMLGRHVTNYSSASKNGGLALRVTAGIGYDVDWRQVHELMKSAAQATDHILDQPEPAVLQTSLNDFAVEYQLVAWTDDPKRMMRTQSGLRQNVLDQFNEAGVEIMTPNVNAVRNSVEPAIPESFVAEPTSPALRFLGIQGG